MIPHTIRVGALVLATTGFYAYVGQLVPQKEVQPPQETALGANMSTADMVKSRPRNHGGQRALLDLPHDR